MEELFALIADALGQAQMCGDREQCLQDILALPEGGAAKIVALALEQVENVKIDRGLLFLWISRGAIATADAGLEQLKARTTQLIERHDLSIQLEAVTRNLSQISDDLWELLPEWLQVAGEELDLSSVLDGESSNPIVFQLIDPVGGLGDPIDQGCEHGWTHLDSPSRSDLQAVE